jgi:dTDP-4-dehydrorhamnose reductase
MTLRILLTGKNGQVGSELARFLPSIGEVVALGRAELDLTRADSIRRVIAQLRPKIIINAAAYTAVDQAEQDEPSARAINAEAPGVMAEEAKKIGAFLIHYSTDYVFDGAKRSPYVEADPTNPLGAYGRTKFAGEEAIEASGVPHLILRTAWVYATSGKNFLLTVLRLASTREELRIVNDQCGAPTSARAIAIATARVVCCSGGASPAFLLLPNSATKLDRMEPGSATRDVLERDPIDFLAQHTGTYHLTAAGETTWYEFAVAVLNGVQGLIRPAEGSHAPTLPPATPWLAAATGGRPIMAKRVVPITTAEYPTPARRPAYSVLSNVRFASAFGFSLPDWRAQLAETIQSRS